MALQIVAAKHRNGRAHDVDGTRCFGCRLEEINHALWQFTLSTQCGGQFVEFDAVRQLVVVKKINHFLVTDFDEFIDVVTAVKEHAFRSLDFPETGFSSDDSFETFGYNRHGSGRGV